MSATPRIVRAIAWVAAALAAPAIVLGCRSIGPPHVVRDRFDYAEAISRSWKENMLLNLVKLRYADAPLFLDVSSVVEQYSLQGQVSTAAQFPAPSSNPSSVGGTLQWADRPTITLQPLTGQHFTKSLLTPLSPVAIMDLVQAGWPVNLVFRFGVRSINGIRAATPNRLMIEAEDPRFPQLLDALLNLQRSDGIGVRREQTKGGEEETFVVIPPSSDERLEADRLFVTKTLGLNPALKEYRLTFGAVSTSKDEIALVTRTVFEILVALSFDVQVPPEHEHDGRVGPALPAGVQRLTSLRVSSGKARPGDVFTAVRYENYWFWIDNRDFSSKRTLSLMMILLALAEKGEPVAAPALTLPTGP
jgi:hypothetical protein